MSLKLDVDKTVLDTKKEAGERLILNLNKVGLSRKVAKSRVALALDISGSADILYTKKVMHAIATRVAGIALNLDDNGDLDVYVFNTRAKKLAGLTVANAKDYVKKNVAPIVGGGTNYAPVLRAVKQDYGAGDPVFLIFITDGKNDDQDEAIEALVDLSYHGPVFVQTIGVGLDLRESFANLQAMNELGTVDKGGPRLIDNAGFCTLDFKHATDDQLYDALLNEYPTFLAECQKKGYLPWTKSPLAQRSVAARARGFLGGLFGG